MQADPLNEQRPPVSGRSILVALMSVAAVAGACVAVWYVAFRAPQTPNKPPQFEPDPFHVREEIRQKARDESLEHMKKLGQALTDYRERFGGGLRWPTDLGELTSCGLLDANFEFVGALSGEPIVYQPELPVGQPPEVWVMAADIMIEKREREYYLRPGMRDRGAPRISAAVVILGDGSVRALDSSEIGQYAGFSSAAEAFERALKGVK
ncbi:MAG: hypothetical protein IT462_13550 [Planctomycetes bacterium]|nr:hypothetical protein [Planctomycetota bacterium]